jgi:DnaK suppressor protein
MMSVDTKPSSQGRFTALRTSLSEEFAAQTARLKQLTTDCDPGEAHNRAALLVATRQSLDQISGALRRLAEGTYGTCEECEAPIPPERLEVLPHARYCVACQQKRHG